MAATKRSRPAETQYCLRGDIDGVEQLFLLRRGENRIGALDSNEVVLPLTGVSRVHARLVVDSDGELQLEDLASKNGTFVDGQRVTEKGVTKGQQVRFGPIKLRLDVFHHDDAELAISFDYGVTEQTASLGTREVGRTLTPNTRTGTGAAVGNHWRAVSEALLERLIFAPPGEAAAAIGQLQEDLHVTNVALFELPSEGDPIVIAAVGPVGDSAGERLRAMLGAFPTSTPPRQVRWETTIGDTPNEADSLLPAALAALGADPDSAAGDDSSPSDALAEAPLTLAALHSVDLDPIVLALWGRFPERGDSEGMLSLLVRMLDGHRPRQTGGAGASSGPHSLPGLIVPNGYVHGRSAAMRTIYELMQTLSRGDLPILIIGETGVGKEYLARILHDSSPRRQRPFVAINCAAIPADLLEAELFGIGEGVATGVSARKGRFQSADGGTLFLDEIGDMSADLQAKLLRALQENVVSPLGQPQVKVDVRVLAATNQELPERISAGSFRADLYYRLAGYVLEIPPLRDRQDDIPPLVEHFLRQGADELDRPIRGLTVRALRMLVDYPWPGNVRELANEVRRAVYLCPKGQPIEGSTLSKSLQLHFGDGSASASMASSNGGASSGSEDSRVLPQAIGLGLDSLDLENLEGAAIHEALRRCDGNQVQAAKLLGISRQKLRRRMEKLGYFDAAGGHQDTDQANDDSVDSGT